MIEKLVKKVRIGLNGTVAFIHDDDLAELMGKLGKTTIMRASNVEPDEYGKWNATMFDGIVLGPFNRRDEALKEEVKYLEKQLFKGE